MNNVQLIGRLTRDPEIKISQGDNPVCIARFTLAVDRRFKREGDQTADFISCVAFGKTAEFFDKYIKQGTKIGLTGRIQTGSYTRQDGQKVYTTDVVVENAEFAESKQASAPAAPQQPAQAQAAVPASAPGYAAPPQQAAPPAQAPDQGFVDIPSGFDDDTLPF